MPEGEVSGQVPATETTEQAAGAEPTAPATEDAFDADRAMKTIRAQRDEIKVLKQQTKRSAELEAKVKEFEDAQKSESEKSAEKLAQLERDVATRDERIQTLTIRGAFSEAARDAGALYPDDVYKLADLGKVEYDDAGEPKNLGAIVEGLKADRPALFGEKRPPSFEGGRQGGSTDSGPTMDDRLRSAVRGAGR